MNVTAPISEIRPREFYSNSYSIEDHTSSEVSLLVSKHYLEIALEEIAPRFNEPDQKQYLLDQLDHYFQCLPVIVAFGEEALFKYETQWLSQVLYSHFQLEPALVLDHLRQAIAANHSCPNCEQLLIWLAKHRQEIVREVETDLAFNISDYSHAGIIREIVDKLVNMDRRGATANIRQAGKDLGEVSSLYSQVLQPSLEYVGYLWEHNDITVAQSHFSAATVQYAMSLIFEEAYVQPNIEDTIAISGVENNGHQIGLRMIADVLELNGWGTLCMGSNLPTRELLKTIQRKPVKVLAISASITPDILKVKSIVDRLRSDISLSDVKILVGGRPFQISPDLWHKVGADGSANCPEEAVTWVDRVVEKFANN